MGWLEELRIRKAKETAEKKIRDEAESARTAVEKEQEDIAQKVVTEEERIKEQIPIRMFQDAVDKYTAMMVAAQSRFQPICDQMNEIRENKRAKAELVNGMPARFMLSTLLSDLLKRPYTERWVDIKTQRLEVHLSGTIYFEIIQPGLLAAKFPYKEPILIQEIDVDFWAEAIGTTMERRMEMLRSIGIKELKDAKY